MANAGPFEHCSHERQVGRVDTELGHLIGQAHPRVARNRDVAHETALALAVRWHVGPAAPEVDSRWCARDEFPDHSTIGSPCIHRLCGGREG